MTNISDAQFPFGQPLKMVKQEDRSKKDVFVLGVQASAVHAKWFFPKGKLLCKALAVASEPEIFWNGENATEIIEELNKKIEVGHLKPAEERFNGSSGRVLEDLYLEPLSYSRAVAWLCDLVPHSLMDKKQKNAITKHYIPLCKKNKLPSASVPEKLRPLRKIDDKRLNEILAELEKSQAETIILLGNEPLKCFLSVVSDCKKKSLKEFGDNTKTYGMQHSVSINGKTYKVRPLTHPGNIIRHLKKWERLHRNWVANMNSRK